MADMQRRRPWKNSARSVSVRSMENEDDDRRLDLECPQCGRHGTAYISPANEITQIAEGFDARQDHGLDHTFTCLKCGSTAKLVCQ